MEAVTDEKQFQVRCTEWVTRRGPDEPVVVSEEEAKRVALEFQGRRPWAVYEVVPSGTPLVPETSPWRVKPPMSREEAIGILQDLVQESPRHEAALKRLLA